MSSRLDKAIKDFIQIIREAGNKGTSPLDAQAEVLRIDEDGTAWVHLPGGVDETPVKLTINAEVGDKVYVRLSGGRAWITGNQTAPPTDDKTAIVAKSLANIAGNRAKTAQKTADQAQIVADSALKGTKENATQMAKMVLDFNGDIKNLQNQIDGNIATWFYDVDPDMGLPPVTDWDTDEKKDAHLGDIYYNTVKGYAWRFMKSGSTYSWERITDTDVTKALADAAKAQDTADSKRRVFYNTPTVPYDAGDLWVQGSGGDILRCAQAKTSTGSYDRNDWVLASKYTDDSALNAWIEGDFATTIQELEEGLVDAKVETYYQATDPSTGWSDTQKSEHKGDLWYNSTASVQKYYRWSGTAWQELTATPPQAVFDNIDKKATIYTGTTTPTNPDSGDLWFKGANEPILTYVDNSWVEYNKYTDDSTLNTWLTDTYDVDKTNLQNQIDGKAETWYQATDPSLDWSAADKPNHEGDLWYNTSDNTTWYYTGTAWSQQSIPTSVFNNINGKANIFVGSITPENPKTGDLWLESASSDILTYVDGSWVKYNKYTDDTKAERAQAEIDSIKKRVVIGNDSVDIVDSTGKLLASYGDAKIELGKNAVSSIIEMCGGMARVSARYGGLTTIYSHNGGYQTTLDYDFNETIFKSKVGSNYGFYEFSYSGGVWECSYSGNNAGYVQANLNDYGITLKTTSINEYAGITIQYWNGSEATFINADTTKPSRKLILGLAESGTADNLNYANIEIERSKEGNVEHSKINLVTVHDGANVAGVQLDNGNIELDVSGEVLINNIPLDYIVEQGTYIGWKYRKWNSGIAECFGYISLGSISVSAVGNVYRGTATVVLPDIFNDIPSNVHITNGNPLSSVISINGRATDVYHVPVYVWKATKGAVDSVYASFHVIGTWK